MLPLVYSANAPGNFNRLLKIARMFPALPFRNTDNFRSLISPEIFVDCIFTYAIHPGVMGETFVSSEIIISVREPIELLAKSMGQKLITSPIPLGLMKVIAKLRRKKRAYNQLFGPFNIDSTKITKLLRWFPKSDPVELIIRTGYKYNINNHS